MLAHVLKFANQRQYTPYTSYGHSPMYALREAFNRLSEDHFMGNLAAQMPASDALGFLPHPSSMFQDPCMPYIILLWSNLLMFIRFEMLQGLSTGYSRFGIVRFEEYALHCSFQRLALLRSDLDWHMLNGDIPLREIVAVSFPGYILRNLHERPIIARYFEGPSLDRAGTMRNMLSFGGEEMIPGRWLCRICIKELLGTCAMPWWVEHLNTHGRNMESLDTCG